MSRLVLLAAAALASGTGTAVALWTEFSVQPPMVQPVAFNHDLHGSNGIECTTCHTGVDASAAARIPELALCMECHGEDDPDTPDKERMLALAAAEGELPWKRLYRLPAHVVFSHERHVAMGGLDCGLCHGGHGQSKAPPPVPESAALTMGGCMECHEARGASNDCMACHR